MKTMTLEEFRTEMKSQGKPIGDVTFQCPRCKTLQSANDLITAGAGKNFEEVEGYLGFSCIGRFTDNIECNWTLGFSHIGRSTDNIGCNWTLGGLLRIHELEVVTPDGEHHPRFMPMKEGEE